MSIYHQFQSLVSQPTLTRRQALIGLSFLGLTACSQSASSGDKPASGAAYYTCSMHPSVHSATPGQCPFCGMDLVPAKAAASGTKE